MNIFWFASQYCLSWFSFLNPQEFKGLAIDPSNHNYFDEANKYDWDGSWVPVQQLKNVHPSLEAQFPRGKKSILKFRLSIISGQYGKPTWVTQDKETPKRTRQVKAVTRVLCFLRFGYSSSTPAMNVSTCTNLGMSSQDVSQTEWEARKRNEVIP